MNTNVVGHAVSDANDLTTEIAEVTEFRQNERNFHNRGNGISEMEGKVARVAASETGAERVSNHGLRGHVRAFKAATRRRTPKRPRRNCLYSTTKSTKHTELGDPQISSDSDL